MRGSKLMKKLIDQELKELHVALPAKIENYDAKKMIAEVTLLSKKKLSGEEVTIPKIIEVSVAHFNAGPFIIRPPYKKGDTVQVLFNERALDKLLITGNPESIQYKRKHSFDDAVVVKGIKVEQEADLPDEELESLYISNLDKKVKLYINPDGTFRIANDQDNIQVEVVIEKDGVIRIADNKNGTELKFDINNAGDAIFKLANKLFLGSSVASEAAALGTSLKSWLDRHTHPGDSGGTTSPPNSPSPDPSSKVFLE